MAWALSGRALVYFLAFALLLRVVWAFVFAPTPVSDFAQYHSLATALAHGQGYTRNGRATAFLPPGYPGFLAAILWLTKGSLLAARVANAFLGFGVVYFSYRIAQHVLRSEVAARAVLLILALYPNHIAYVSLLSTELLFLFLFTLAIWLFIGETWWGSIVGGLALGSSALVKPVGLFIFAAYWVIRLATATSRRRKRAAVQLLVAGAGLVAVLTPWAVRNYHVFGSYVSISNHGGQTLLIGHNPSANGGYSKTVFDTRIAPLRAGRSEVDADRLASRMAVDYAKSHIGRELTLLPRKLLYLYAKDGEGFYFNQRGLSPKAHARRFALKILKVANYAFYWILLLVCLVALVRIVFRQRMRVRRELIIPFGLAASITLYYLGFFGMSRFHFPIVPWLAMLAVYPLAQRNLVADSAPQTIGTPAG